MVKHSIPDWQRSAFDKDNNSCVKTKPFAKRIKEFAVAYAKVDETKIKVEDIDMSVFLTKKEPLTKQENNKDNELEEFLHKKNLKKQMNLRDQERKIR